MLPVPKRLLFAALATCCALGANAGVTPPTVETIEAESDTAAYRQLPESPPPGLDNPDAGSDQAAVIAPDLLSALPAGFRLPYRDTRAVRAEFDWYRRNPDYLERVFTRARPYLPYIAAELRARDMPMELALLPVVESAFDPFAYSHGQAAGLWQFIPATGRRFGLEQNWWYDGRRDVVESTRAAIEYLDRLQRMFDGDWLLAIAAYNSGEGKVRRARRKRGGDASFWELALPRETRAYVPRLLALSRLVAAPGDFGIVLPHVPDTPQFRIIDTGGQIDLALAAGLANVDIETIYRFNPALNRWATPPDGPHRLLLPLDEATTFESRLAEVPAAERLRWQRYRVSDGDTLSEIAARHHVTVSAIQDANSLRGTTIRAGSHILIPVAHAQGRDYALSADARLARRLERAADATRYTVRAGDSLWTIARRHGVGVGELARWNGMSPRDTLSVGRELAIRNAVDSAPATVEVIAANDATRRRIQYVVRKGDSLARISSRFSVSVAQLKRWNGSIATQKYLYPGQKLVMYIDVRDQSGV